MKKAGAHSVHLQLRFCRVKALKMTVYVVALSKWQANFAYMSIAELVSTHMRMSGSVIKKSLDSF